MHISSNRDLFLNHLGQTSDDPYLLEISRAESVFMYDTKGKEYIDLISGVSVSALGHNFKIINEAIKEQIAKHLHLMVYGEFIQAPQVELAKYLIDILPKSLNSIYYVNSGSEAIEAAMKLAKKYTKKSKIFAFKNAYHGSTQGALSLCGNDDFKKDYYPLLPDIHFLELNNYENLNLIDDNTACVFLETIQAEAGVIIPEKDYLIQLKKCCVKNNVLLIFDEVQTGLGRTGQMFAFQHYDIVPDILCLAKAFGAGLPLGAIITDKKIMDTFKDGPGLGHITTFGGHPLCCAAALAAIKYVVENDIVNSIRNKENLFRKLLISKNIVEIRGKGLLLAVELENQAMVKKTIKKGLEEGFISDGFIFYDKAFRIAPPLNITENQIFLACEKINKVLNSL